MKAALRRDGRPPALLPRTLGNPLTAPPHSRLRPGPWDLQILPRSRLAWESPHGRLIVPLLPLFLCCIVPVISILHTAAAAQESVAAAEAAAEAAAGAQVSCWGGLPAQSCPSQAGPRVPALCPAGGVHGTQQALFGVSWFLVLGVEGRRLWAQAPHFPAMILGGIHMLHVSSSQVRIPAQVRIPVSQYPTPLSTGLSVLLTGPNKAEEMEV